MTLIYNKKYTRDNGLILQESWSYAHLEGFEKAIGELNPFNPPNIYFVNNGATEIWDCDKAYKWFFDKLLEKNREGQDFYKMHVQTYMKILEKLEQYKIKGVLDSIQELKEFIEFLFLGSRHFVIFYYSSYDERTPKDIREMAMQIRKVDSFYDDCEKIIKKTISRLFPRAEGMELVVTLNDLDAVPERPVLEARMKNCIFIPGQEMELMDLKEFQKQHPEYKFLFEDIPEEILKSGILKGQIANKGMAKGKVRILRKKSQITELEDGEILISTMTTPDFVPAMEKAAAIVTDEGGITCHAAVVARELGKPCIIGTKFATEFLRNGDMVEVDADKGIIIKIK